MNNKRVLLIKVSNINFGKQYMHYLANTMKNLLLLVLKIRGIYVIA